MNSSKSKIIKGAYTLLAVSALYVGVLLAGAAFANQHEDKDHGHAHERETTQGEHTDKDHGHAHESHADGDEEKGFQLSAEAFKNFGIQLRKIETGAPLKLSRKSIFFGLEERNLYRYRDGFFKRVDFKTLSKTKTEFTVTSDDLIAGDEIAVEGLGFLRIAELAAFGGVAEGHSH